MIKYRFFIVLILFLVSCSPRIDKVTYEDEFKKWNSVKKINEIDSSASMSVEFNTFRGLFQGRESFLSFKKNRYSIQFNKLDTFYTEKDIKYFSMYGYFTNDTSFIPDFCRVNISHISDDRIIIEFNIKDSIIQDRLKGKFKLKFSNSVPNVSDVFKYYTN